ncbi:hypothetical protein [Streptomyces sp. NPDC050738]|uniref:hypothetical protein n=1 Tax=Streptomyces sp. NPDC050738 TaxID=3154744 RepID=UPI0034162EB1
MGPLTWSADLMTGLKPWQRALMIVCLCALTLPLWFAAKNAYRYVDGHNTKTEGYVRCDMDGPCRGTWGLPGGQQGAGEIEGLTFEYDEELITNVPLFAGRDWAVTDRSTLISVAAAEVAAALLGAALVVGVAWIRS